MKKYAFPLMLVLLGLVLGVGTSLAVFWSASTRLVANAAELELSALHVLNNFDLPKGALREPEKDDHGNSLADYTVWTSANDLKAKKFYFRTYQNSQIRTADLTKMTLDAKDITKVSMQGDEVIKSLTP